MPSGRAKPIWWTLNGRRTRDATPASTISTTFDALERLRPAGDLDRFELADGAGGLTEAVRGEDVDDLIIRFEPKPPLTIPSIDLGERGAHLLESLRRPRGRARTGPRVRETSTSVVARGLCAAWMANRATIRPPTRHHRSSSPSCTAIAATVCQSRCSSGSSALIVIDATGAFLAASLGANALTDPRDHLTADSRGAWIRVLGQSDRDSG
jgi:hypothetical protein